MRSVWLLSLFGLLSLACAGPAPTAAAPTAPSSAIAAAQDITSKTVALVGRDADGAARSFCSGVWVSKYSIVTAAHCVRDESLGGFVDYVVKSDVYAPGDLNVRENILTRRSVLYALDPPHDLALLSAITPPEHPSATISTRQIAPGLPVQAVGQSVGLWWSYSRGDVAAVRYVDTSGSGGAGFLFVQSTTPISPGNSGCGLFDAFGDLVGIAHATMTRGQNLNLFIHWQYVGALVKLKMVF